MQDLNVTLVSKGATLGTKLLLEAYRKPYLYYIMTASDVTYDDLARSHKGHGIFNGLFARKRCRLDIKCQ